MPNNCTIQIFADGRWQDAGVMSLVGPEEQGHRAKTFTGYDTNWALEYRGARDAWAFASGFVVGLTPVDSPHWPVFLIDMLPQGYGRGELLRELKLQENIQEEGDWRLLLAGAGNPIGHMRIKEAALWLEKRTGAIRGFADEEVATRAEGFVEYLTQNGLFVAGSSGVQGEWPKILLTRARDGLLYLDHTLPDADAVEHFIVKFGRGPNQRLAQILAQEAPYMDIAQRLGLRVHRPLALLEKALFIPRFDRRVIDGHLTRFAQESLATLLGKPGFGPPATHDDVVVKLAEVCTEPQAEILEYIKRDVANLALGNKDNHARNTAIQRDFENRIGLTPLFDFAPMYLHPDGIARRIRWEGNDNSAPDWKRVIDTVCAAVPSIDRVALVQGVLDMVPRLEELARDGVEWGLDPAVHEYLRPGIGAQAQALAGLA
jgi:serine/threonine-protein kinase HipA